MTAVDAARANAAWCDLVCRAHGGRTGIREAAWVNLAPSPPLYPNLVTVAVGSGAGIPALVDEVRQGVGVPGWGLKDSFSELDLAGAGFDLLFEASWIGAEAAAATADAQRGGLEPELAETPGALAEWGAAWSRGEPHLSAEDAMRLFEPVLAAGAPAAFIACRRGRAIAGGGIAHAVHGVIDVTNLFAEDDAPAVIAGVARAARARFGRRPLTGYAGAGGLASWRAAGFETLGPLRVWLSRA